MASQAYEQILQIQALDLSITQLRHRRDNHPARDALTEIDRSLDVHRGEVAEVEQRRHELERQQKRLEDEVALLTAKRQDIDGKLYGGEVTASKELLALQDEAASLLGRQTDLEDQDLEVMEQVEQIDGELADLGSRRAVIDEERARHQRELDDAVAHLDGEIAGLEAQRAEVAAPASPELLARYEELRGQFDGVAVARLADGRCDGCHIQLSAVAVDRIAKMPEDAVVTCEECGRLLVR